MKKILIVDDERENREEVAGVLGRRYKVETAADPIEALAVMDTTFNLVLSDLNMPGYDGMWLAREVKKKFSDIPIVIVSGMAECINNDEAKEAGIKVVLSKPLNINELFAVIACIVGE